MSEVQEFMAKAIKEAPSQREVEEQRELIDSVQEQYDELFEEFKKLAVARARIYGWVATSKEAGVSPKQIHTWAKDIPGVDFSKVVTNKELDDDGEERDC